MIRNDRPYRGRFAPSPTGNLHLGSLVAAVASYLEARTCSGEWLVRIEDIDPPREVAGSAFRILRDLKRFRMVPDGEVLYQSTRKTAYANAVERLLDEGHAYWCGCSRSDLPPSGIYPGTCRKGLPRGRRPRSVRLRTEGVVVTVMDGLQGSIEEDLETTAGDFVIRRADGLPAYQLAVVVDDAFQEISHIVRGADLLESTARQICLQAKLGLPTPEYVHVPVVLGPEGTKLSKRLQSDPLTRREHVALESALLHLGHKPPPGLDLGGLWGWALESWSIEQVPRQRELPHSETSAGTAPRGYN